MSFSGLRQVFSSLTSFAIIIHLEQIGTSSNDNIDNIDNIDNNLFKLVLWVLCVQAALRLAQIFALPERGRPPKPCCCVLLRRRNCPVYHIKNAYKCCGCMCHLSASQIFSRCSKGRSLGLRSDALATEAPYLHQILADASYSVVFLTLGNFGWLSNTIC